MKTKIKYTCKYLCHTWLITHVHAIAYIHISIFMMKMFMLFWVNRNMFYSHGDLHQLNICLLQDSITWLRVYYTTDNKNKTFNTSWSVQFRIYTSKYNWRLKQNGKTFNNKRENHTRKFGWVPRTYSLYTIN